MPAGTETWLACNSRPGRLTSNYPFMRRWRLARSTTTNSTMLPGRSWEDTKCGQTMLQSDLRACKSMEMQSHQTSEAIRPGRSDDLLTPGPLQHTCGLLSRRGHTQECQHDRGISSPEPAGRHGAGRQHGQPPTYRGSAASFIDDFRYGMPS